MTPETVRILLQRGFKLVSVDGLRLTARLEKDFGSAMERGQWVMDTERELRREARDPVELYLEPMGDTNKLRERLRGVKLE